MNRVLILFFLLLGCCSVKAQNAIIVSLSDGRSQVFMLDSSPCVKYDGNNVVITSNEAELYVETEAGVVAKVVFGDAENTSVESAEMVRPCFRISGKTVFISGVETSSMVQAYDLKGVMVEHDKADDNGEAVLDFKMNGVYIVKTKSFTFRILVK